MKLSITFLLLMVSSNVSAETLAFSKLVSASDGSTYFEDDSLVWNPFETTNGTALATDLLEASNVGFLTLPAGSRSDWHPAPRKQYVMVLIGTMEVIAGNNESRVFTPGSVLLVTDTEGQGHKTNALHDEEVFLVWVPIP